MSVCKGVSRSSGVDKCGHVAAEIAANEVVRFVAANFLGCGDVVTRPVVVVVVRLSDRRYRRFRKDKN